MYVFGRILAFLLLLGLLAAGGVAIYNAGVSAGIASDVGNAIASGGAVPVPYYPGPYYAHPWGFGFPFFGFLFGIFFLFLIFGLLRAVVGGGHHGRWHHDGSKPRNGGWESHLNEWHDARHAGTPPTAPTPPTS
jgi:hypothetical protein